MMVTTLFFWFYAVVLLGAAIGVISARNPVHSAMFLVLSFVTSAALWILLEAEFLGIALVLVYVGAVMVLFLFVVMMLDINVENLRAGFTRYAPVGILFALLLAVQLGYVLWTKQAGFATAGAPPPHPADYSNTKELGAVLYTEYVYAFELAAVILLVAIIAAIALTMRRRPGLKVQDITKQVAVKAEDRVRIVSMPAEKRE